MTSSKPIVPVRRRFAKAAQAAHTLSSGRRRRGNLGGFVGPYAIGWIKNATGETTLGLVVLAAGLGWPGAPNLQHRRGEGPPPPPSEDVTVEELKKELVAKLEECGITLDDLAGSREGLPIDRERTAGSIDLAVLWLRCAGGGSEVEMPADSISRAF
jgi:hypothetical protein